MRKLLILMTVSLLVISPTGAQVTEVNLDNSRFFGENLGTWYYSIGSIPASSQGTSVPINVFRNQCGDSFKAVTWEKGETVMDKVDSSKGYLFVSRNSCSVSIQKEDYQSSIDLTLNKGWNIVSVPASTQGFNFANIAGNCKVKNDESGNSKELFEILNGQDVNSIPLQQNMDAKKAYWVEVSSNCRLVFGSDNYLQPPDGTSSSDGSGSGGDSTGSGNSVEKFSVYQGDGEKVKQLTNLKDANFRATFENDVPEDAQIQIVYNDEIILARTDCPTYINYCTVPKYTSNLADLVSIKLPASRNDIENGNKFTVRAVSKDSDDPFVYGEKVLSYEGDQSYNLADNNE